MIFEDVLRMEPELVVISSGNNECEERRTYATAPGWLDPLDAVARRLVVYRLVRGSRVGQGLFPGSTLPGHSGDRALRVPHRRDGPGRQATLIALAMMMHQYETSLVKARAIAAGSPGPADLDEDKRRRVPGVAEIVPEILALEARDLRSEAVRPEERTAAARKLEAFYRSAWGERP
jgi:hypothetical protein